MPTMALDEPIRYAVRVCVLLLTVGVVLMLPRAMPAPAVTAIAVVSSGGGPAAAGVPSESAFPPAAQGAQQGARAHVHAVAAQSLPTPETAAAASATAAPATAVPAASRADRWCAAPPAVQPSRMPSRRDDWIFAADGDASSWASQFRLEPTVGAGKHVLHLINRLSGGCVSRPQPGTVRGHRNASPRNRAAPPSATTELQWTAAPTEERAHDRGSACEVPARVRFVFTEGRTLPRNGDGRRRGGGAWQALAVTSDGSATAIPEARCASEGHACDFDVLPADASSATAATPAANTTDNGGWWGLRSVATGERTSRA